MKRKSFSYAVETIKQSIEKDIKLAIMYREKNNEDMIRYYYYTSLAKINLLYCELDSITPEEADELLDRAWREIYCS